MLTTQILVKNNEKTIKKTLDSIKSVSSKIIIGNLGSTDNTIKICSEYDVEIVDIDSNNRSEIRNNLSRGGFNFYINPWEVLQQGQDYLINIYNSCNVYIFEDNVIYKEQRIWKEEKFINPVFETIINKKAITFPEIVIISKDKPNDLEEKLLLVKNWNISKPLDIEPYYYMACCYLSLGNYDKFRLYSNEYFMRENNINHSYIMLKYYSSKLNLFLNKIKIAAEEILFCLSYYPAHAEFWCLLGDIYYKQKVLNKAKSFYENAIIIGEKRKNDEMPIEIDKYKEYPEKMIKIIENIINKSKLYDSNKQYLIH